MSALWTALVPLTALPKTISLFYSPQFNGQNGDLSRLEIRKALRSQLEVAGYDSTEELLDLQRRPFHPDLHISISHCRDAGLFGWVNKPIKMGVDVEQRVRLEPHLLRRVSTTAELKEAPRPELLWSAKEAAFKSRSEAIEVISSVEVFDWQLLEPEIWSFRTRLTHDKSQHLGFGEIRLLQAHTVAFFIAKG